MTRRQTTAALAAVAAVTATALAAGTVFGSGSGLERPGFETVTVDLSEPAREGARAKAIGGAKKKPKVVYLESSAPTAINPADPSAGGLGPYIDIRLTGCSKVLGGGVVPSSTEVFIQGSYVKSPKEYHVLIALDDGGLATRTPFTISSNLTCLKGVK